MTKTLHIHNTTSNTIMEFDVNTATGEIINARPDYKKLWVKWKVMNTTFEKGMLLELQLGEGVTLTSMHPVIKIINK